MNTFNIRPLEAADRAGWRQLFEGYAVFYKTAMTDAIADTVWAWLTDDTHVLEALIAHDDAGVPAGFVHLRACPRPLGGNSIGFVDDMFIAEPHRGTGMADALIEAVGALARSRQWPAVRWVTQHYNARGRAVYDRFTGGPSDFIMYNWPQTES